MEMLSVFGIALVGTAVCLLLRQYKPEYALFASVITAVILLSFGLKLIEPLTSLIKSLMNMANVRNEYASAIIKSLGICYVTKLSSDVCADFNQTVIAGKVELIGKLMIIGVSLPLLEALTKTALDLIG